MKTSELQGPALDWAVAKCEGADEEYVLAPDQFLLLHNESGSGLYCFSTDWSQGGPIIEREKISLECEQYSFEWCAYRPEYPEDRAFVDYGPTPLIAAMRCYVASKLGDEVEVPHELA